MPTPIDAIFAASFFSRWLKPNGNELCVTAFDFIFYTSNLDLLIFYFSLNNCPYFIAIWL